MATNIAYLSGSKLHLKTADETVRIIESRFGREVRDRAVQIHQRNSWKTQGTGANFMMRGGLLWGVRDEDPAAVRIAITGLTWGNQPDELFYSLEADRICGVFALRNSARDEHRVLHSSDYRVAYLNAQRGGEWLACSLLHGIGTANIAVMRGDGADFIEVTEGDSIDLAPSWVPGEDRELVFQSAGIGRDQNGNVSGHGQFSITQLNLETGQMSTVVDDPKYDMLGPRVGADGALYCIRRPYKDLTPRFSIWRFILDILLFPFRLVWAVFQFLNFFTVRYTGKPLSNSGPAAQREMDIQRMMVWGNMIDASRVARDSKGDESPSLVPKSWELVRQRGSEVEVVARGVLSFDLCGDTLVYSNGNAIFEIGKDGSSQKVLSGKMIEQVVAAEW